MKKRVFRPLTGGKLKPEGWLYRQLRIQAEGLSGHLDLIWPDIRDSKWIGGSAEGWERVPYWLDGFIPLAFLLEDKELQGRAKRYVDGILERQQEDGWICPCEKEERGQYDVWAAFLICKVLTVYHDCTGDERIEQAVYRALKNLLDHITRVQTIFNWASARWYECLVPLLWLYERRPEEWMLQLAYVLDAEGMDYEKMYERFDFVHPPVKKYWTYQNHVVNTAMALKSRALMSLLTGEDPDRAALHMYETLQKHNSMACGHFTGDECLSGDSPIQGSELCSVAEAMYSCEVLLSIGGNPFWGDLLEKEAYNALPATISPDMWTHQYDQMTNQIECRKIPDEEVHFVSNQGESHLFGLEPNFGCCTANFNQAWPKFALSAVMESENGLAVTLLAPCCVRTQKDGVPVTLRVETEYPFRDQALILVETERPVEMELLIRIPGTADSARVNGETACPGSFFALKGNWSGERTVRVELDFSARLMERPGGARAAVRGPLVFALPVAEKRIMHEYVKDGVERKYPYCDYELLADSPWNYGFASEELETVFCDMTGSGDAAFLFSPEGAPLRLRSKLVRVPWEEKNGVCAAACTEPRALGEPEEKELVPYGCTNLRMTEMPVVGAGE